MVIPLIFERQLHFCYLSHPSWLRLHTIQRFATTKNPTLFRQNRTYRELEDLIHDQSSNWEPAKALSGRIYIVKVWWSLPEHGDYSNNLTRYNHQIGLTTVDFLSHITASFKWIWIAHSHYTNRKYTDTESQCSCPLNTQQTFKSHQEVSCTLLDQ